VALLRKKNSPDAVDETSAVQTAPAVPGAKGRPTPKRRDSVRRPAGPALKAPQTRREAIAWQKQARRNALLSADPSMDKTQYRAALRAGDDRVLTSRDRGPVKALARDYVDSRRMLANYLFALLPLVILSTAVPALSILSASSLVLLILITIEGAVTGKRIRRLALEREGSVPNGAGALGWYAVSRASMPRRWRLPAPRVEVGADI
jgi:hypothetical protein